MTMSALFSLILLAPALAAAQPGDVGARLMSDKAVVMALERAKINEPEIIAEQIRICEIPAPPFGEEKRGLELKAIFTRPGISMM